MKIKQYQVSRAYLALSRLNDARMPVPVACAIEALMSALKKHYDAELDAEHKTLEKYGGSIKDGRIALPDKDKYGAYQKEIDAVLDLDVTVDVNPITIPCNDMQDVRISPADIRALAAFVKFK